MKSGVLSWNTNQHMTHLNVLETFCLDFCNRLKTLSKILRPPGIA